jgi:hypothetical protein
MKTKKKMKSKTARRWLNRNAWKMASLKIGVFVGKRSRFVQQYLRCLSTHEKAQKKKI